MGTYKLGSQVHLRAIFWERLLPVAAIQATNALVTPYAHGFSTDDPFIITGQGIGGLNPINVYGEPQAFYVIVVDARTFQVAYAPGGVFIPLTANAGNSTIAVAEDPTTVTGQIVTPDNAATTLAVPRTSKAIYECDYITAQIGDHTYTISGSGIITAVASDVFVVE